jgi:allantoinase
MSARCIIEATEAIVAHEGKPPTGWLGPSLSQSYESLDYLKAAGCRYMMDWPCDDQSIWFSTKHGPILSVPYPLDVNDSMLMLTRLASPVEFADALIGNFDEMLEQSQRQPLVMGIALHSHILGQPYQLREFRRAMRRIVSFSKRIWLTHPGEICRYIEGLPEGVVPKA